MDESTKSQEKDRKIEQIKTDISNYIMDKLTKYKYIKNVYTERLD